MSEQLSSTESTRQSSDLRVAIIIPGEQPLFASPNLERPTLFTDTLADDERLSAELRATRIGQRQPRYGLPAMSVLSHLGTIENIQGIVVRPATGTTINLRQFTVRAYDFNDVTEYAERNPNYIDPVTLAFLTRAFAGRPR